MVSCWHVVFADCTKWWWLAWLASSPSFHQVNSRCRVCSGHQPNDWDVMSPSYKCFCWLHISGTPRHGGGQMGPLKILGWHPKIQTITESQEFYYAVVVYGLVENYANMRVKNSHTDTLWFLIWQLIGKTFCLSNILFIKITHSTCSDATDQHCSSLSSSARVCNDTKQQTLQYVSHQPDLHLWPEIPPHNKRLSGFNQNNHASTLVTSLKISE